MPTYEYSCQNCGAYFEVKATIEQKIAGLAVKCTRCGSEDVEQVFSGISFITRKRVKGSKGDSCCGESGQSC